MFFISSFFAQCQRSRFVKTEQSHHPQSNPSSDTNNNNNKITMEAPNEWPSEIADAYHPVRELGRGGFASVILARPKPENQITAAKKVAVKVMGCNQSNDGGKRNSSLYAKREIDLLREIRHANIVGLIDAWHDSQRQKKTFLTSGVLILEYAKGPTMESLLQYGGAFSNTFGRVVMAQVMDAVSYLHYRAVVHRDIKPDNIIVSGALSSDDSIWDNPPREDSYMKSTEEWKELCFKYKVTLIDFGFARSLAPDDLESSEAHAIHSKNASYFDVPDDSSLREESERKHQGSLRRRLSRKLLHTLDTLDSSFRSQDSLDGSEHSTSHKMKRVMSTLGNRNYAAPEIVNQVRERSQKERQIEEKKTFLADSTKTISDFVADYGLLVDSFSMGHTIRYMMTGVQPGILIDDALRRQGRNGIRRSFLSKVGLKKKDKTAKTKRKPFYRSLDDLPGPLYQLIRDLTEQSERKRISVRKARRTSFWISDVLSFQHLPKDIDENENDSDKGGDASKVSLDVVSEEQLYPLSENRFLSLATTVAHTSPCDETSATVLSRESFDGLEHPKSSDLSKHSPLVIESDVQFEEGVISF